jgi:hypothetical protein
VEAVYDEILKAVEFHGVRFVDFEDENLTLDKAWCMDLFGKLSAGLGPMNIEYRAMNGLYPPSIDDEIVSAMHSTGFKELNLSLCTISKEQLERFKRRDVREAYESVLESLGKKKMSSVTYVLAGAPGQNPIESVEDLAYLALKDTLCGVSVFYPAPGSRDYDDLSVRNLLPFSFSLMRSSVIPISDTTSRRDSVTLLRLGRIANFCKELIKRGIPLKPEPIDERSLYDVADRDVIGIALVRSFFHDGIIRGIDINGRVFEHSSSLDLCRHYVSLVKKKIAGH